MIAQHYPAGHIGTTYDELRNDAIRLEEHNARLRAFVARVAGCSGCAIPMEAKALLESLQTPAIQPVNGIRYFKTRNGDNFWKVPFIGLVRTRCAGMKWEQSICDQSDFKNSSFVVPCTREEAEP